MSLKALEGAAAWLPTLAARGIFTGSLAYYGRACNDEAGQPSAPAQDVHEKIALIERGPCTFYEKFTNAAKLGAIAVVMFSDERVKTVMACLAPSPCNVGPGIPGVMIDREPGLQLRDLVLKGTEVLTVFDPNKRILLEYFTDTISGFSSRGPGRVDGAYAADHRAGLEHRLGGLRHRHRQPVAVWHLDVRPHRGRRRRLAVAPEPP